MTSISLSNRNILITGASSGLGVHFARICAKAGAKVAICARRIKQLEDLRDEINASGGTAIALEMDIANEDSVVTGFAEAENQLGAIDSVIANAGMNSEGFAIDMTAEEVNRVMSVNVTGTFVTAREAARSMMKADSKTRQHGRIIIISSITAKKVDGGIAAYSASKAGVSQFGKVLAREWANKGISVNMVCPGYIETELNGDWFQTEGGKKQISKWPRRRLMQMSDLDNTVLFLASDEANGVTGSEFTIDDGQSL